MTVLGSAAAVYAGGVRASAVYAGAVKVWPAGLPEATGVAYWADGVSLRLVFPTMPLTGSAVFDVVAAPSPLLHPDRILGGTTVGGTGSQPVVWFGTETGAGVTVTDAAWRGVHNGDAATRLGGMRVTVTRGGGTVTRLAVLGATPRVAHAQDDGARMLVWDQYAADLKTGGAWPLAIVCSPVFRSLGAARCDTYDAASVYITVHLAGAVNMPATAADWVRAADGRNATLTYTGYGMIFDLDWRAA